MDFELVFSFVGVLALSGWLALLFSPFAPAFSDRYAGKFIPLVLAVAYVIIAILYPAESGGFESFSSISTLFSNSGPLMAGWIHFLAFDLFVGSWICQTARDEGIVFWLVLICLPITFLFGPAGYLCFSVIRGVMQLKGKLNYAR